jgi:hypothetical protein
MSESRDFSLEADNSTNGSARPWRGLDTDRGRRRRGAQEPPTDEVPRAFLKKHAWHEKFFGPRFGPADRGCQAGCGTPRRWLTGLCRGAWKEALGREPAPELFPELAPRATGEK